MKRIFLSTVALMALTAAAAAADLPSRRAPPPAYAPVPVFTWTGFYIGANAGYGFSDNNDNNGFGALGGGGFTAINGAGVGVPATPVGGFFNTGANRSRNSDGFVGGGQLGYNYQIGSFVLGVEGDIQYTDFGGSKNSNGAFGSGFGTAATNSAIAVVQPGAPGNVAFFNNGRTRSDYFGTVRGRLGYAFDRLLVYGTGGVAFRDTGRDNNNGFNGFGLPFFAPSAANVGLYNGRSKGDDTGYAVGGGLEYAFTPNITAKIEGLYVNFDNGDKKNGYYGGGVAGNVVGVTNLNRPIVGVGFNKKEDDFAVVRAGVNYKFNLF